MILMIDFDSDTPIYLQIKNQIIMGIAKKDVEIGEELPSVRSLAEDIGVNMHTVNKAYGLLKEDGYIKIDRRKGAIVSVKLEESNCKFKRKMNEDMEYYIGECINRGIKQEELYQLIQYNYDKYSSGNEL